MKWLMLKKGNYIVVIITLMVSFCLQNNKAGAESKECVITNGVLKSYSGDSTVYKIPQKVKRIEFGAFEKATKLKKVIIGSKIKYISKGFIYGNKSIKTILVSKDNKNYSSHNGLLYNKSGKTMLACTPARKNIVIYDKCEKVNEIFGDKIEKITIGKNVRSWESDSERIIGITPNLKSITVKKGNKKLFTKDGVLFMRLDDKSIWLLKYPSAVNADQYIIPNDVSTIMFDAFSNSTIRNLVISENVTKMLSPMYHANIEILTVKGICASETERSLPPEAWRPWDFWKGLQLDEVAAGNLKKYIFENDNAEIPATETYWAPEHVIICSRTNSTTHQYAIVNNRQWCEYAD